MAEDSIQLPIATTVGDKIRAQSNLVGGATVKQEVHTLADADGTLVAASLLARDGIDIAAPTAMPAGGLGVRGWLSAIWTKLNGTLTVSQRALASGTDAVTVVQSGSVAVTGTFFQAMQPVSGTVTVSNPTAVGLTDTQLRAAAIAVTGTFFQPTQPVSGTVTLTNPTAVGLTDSQLRAAAVPVSGAFFPAVQPVSQPNSMAAGALTNLNDVVTLNAQGMNGYSAVVTGTWSGVISLEASVDGVTWNPINGALQGVGTFGTTLTANTQVRGTLGGLSQFRMRLSTVGGGTANVAINAGSGTAGVFMTAPIPLASPTRAQTARVAVGTTAVQLDTSPLTKRRAVEVRYNSNGATAASFIYVGFNGAVTAATGRELSAGESMHLDLSEVTQMWVIASAAAQPVQFTELGE